MFGLRNADLLALTPGISEELDGFYKRLNAFLLVAHNDDGTLISPAPAQVSDLGLPVGTIVPYAGTSVPTGWVLCDGSTYSRAAYKTLFRAIGTTYGAGDGATTFAVPDLRQRFPLGKAASGTGSTLGSTGGAIDHTHTGASHTHTISASGTHTHTISADGTGATGTPSATVKVQSGTGTTVATDAHTHTGPSHNHTGATGAGGDHNHTGTTGADGAGTTSTANPPYVVLNFILLAA